VKTILFERAEKQDPIEPEWFRFDIDGVSYKVLSRGQATRTRANGTSDSFRLPLEKDDTIEEVYFASVSGGVLIVYGFRCWDTDGAAGAATQLVEPYLSVKWAAEIPAFNVGPPLLAGTELYVTAIGFVGKLNIVDGRYLWRHDGLYRSQDNRYNSFDRPRIGADVVEFPESISLVTATRSPYVLRVNRRTGKIIE